MNRGSKTTILRLIEGEDAGRIPVAPPFQGFWALGIEGIPIIESIRKPKLAANVQLEVSSQCGFDAMEASWDWLSPVEMFGCKVRVPERGEIVTRTRLVTGPGSLQNLRIPDPHDDYRALSAAESAERIVSAIGKEKFLYSTLCSPFTLIGEIRGVEAFLLDLFMQPDFAQDMLDMATEVVQEYCRFICKTGIDGVLLCDPTASGSLVNPTQFQEYSSPYMKMCMDVVRQEGCYPMAHICGDTSELIGLIADMGTSIFSFDSSMDLRTIDDEVKNRMTLLGNVDPKKMLLQSANGAFAESMRCIKRAEKARLILGLGDDLVNGTPVENVVAMRRASDRFSAKYHTEHS